MLRLKLIHVSKMDLRCDPTQEEFPSVVLSYWGLDTMAVILQTKFAYTFREWKALYLIHISLMFVAGWPVDKIVKTGSANVLAAKKRQAITSINVEQDARHQGVTRPQLWHTMNTSSNGNIFRVTGHLCGEFTGSRWIPHTKASDTELWCFLWSAPE